MKLISTLLANIKYIYIYSTIALKCKPKDTTLSGEFQNAIEEEFEDTKGVIRIRISKKNRQHNGQKKKDKMTNNDLQNIHIKLKIE